MAHLEGYVVIFAFINEENGYTVMDIETNHGTKSSWEISLYQ